MNIVVISPTYNEKTNIVKLIPFLIEEIFPRIKNHTMNLLIVDDNSPDGTSTEVENFMKKWKNVFLLKGDKKGLGEAYVRGMHYAMDKMGADAVMEFDADFQHDPKDIPHLVEAMDAGADLVVGSRYVPGGAIPKEWGIHRKLISRFGGLFAQIMLWRFDVHDMTSGFKLTKTSFLSRVDLDHLYSKYYAYKLHILHDVLKQKAKTTEVPIIFYERKEGSSKITRKDLFDSFWVVIRLRFDDSKRFIKFLFVGGTGFIVQLITQEASVVLGASHPIGVAIGAEAAIISNFLFNNFWTFSDTKHIKEKGNFITRLFKFNIASFASIIIQYLADFFAEIIFGPTMNIFSYNLPTRIVILFPTIIFLVIPLNYFIYNKVIWKTQKLKDKQINEE